MIPILPELTAKPTAPKSAIAPQLLVGVASFPALLEQSGIALPKRLERELPGIEQAAEQADLMPLPSPVERDLEPRFTLDSGNNFPDPGSLLPLDLPQGGAAKRAVPVPRGNPQIREVSLAAEQRKVPLDLPVSVNPAKFERSLPVNPVLGDGGFSFPEPVVQPASLDAPPSPAVSTVAALEPIPAKPDVETPLRPSQMIERGNGQSRADPDPSAFARDPQPVATQSIEVATRSVSTGEQAGQQPAVEAKLHPPMARVPHSEAIPLAYASQTPQSAKKVPGGDAPAPTRSAAEEGTLGAERKPNVASIAVASGAQQPVDTSELAMEPDLARTSESPRADRAALRPAPLHRAQHASEPAHTALRIVADPQLTPASLVTQAPLTSAEPQPAPTQKTALTPQSTRPIPVATAPQVTAALDVLGSAVEAKSAAPQAPQTAHPPASATPLLADAAHANALNQSPQTVVSHAPAQLETRPDYRVTSQVEAAIEQLVQARETGRAARPEMTVRHSEFGAINVRIEAVGTDLRATLNARDPGFVPAIHAAFAERGIAAPTDAASSQPQRGHDQGSGNANSHSGSAGQGQHSDPRYGNSPGSGQASSQPYREQSRSDDDEASAQHPTASPESESGREGASGLFA